MFIMICNNFQCGNLSPFLGRVAFIACLSLLLACTKPQEAEPTVFSVPSNFPQPAYNFNQNPVTKDGFELGRTLFYDGILSRDGTISCAECHNQAYAFTHHQHDVSHGIDGLVGTRNSLPLQNLAWQKEFFWDGGVSDLDLQPIAPIENPVEMDEKTGNVLAKLRKTSKYPALFKKAYGSEEITSAKFLKALSQFMTSLVSANSRYDKYVRKETGGTLNDDELQGLAIFKQKCASCHVGELFSDQNYHNNGLPVQGVKDVGRFKITEVESDKYKFKVPSLRNVEHTMPYMHDGRFYSLEAVLNHYSDGVQATENLDPLLKKGEKLGIQLTIEEKLKIIAFLKTLSDDEFLKDRRYSEN